MKKIISLVLILTMALCLFAGCQPTKDPTQPAASLKDAASYLEAMYKDTDGSAYTRDFNVVSVVLIDGVSYPVTWAIEVKAGDPAAVSVKDNGNKTATVTIVNSKPTEEVQYNLVGTISDEAGNKETVSFSYVIPAVAASGTVFVEKPEVGVAYKFALEQNELGQTLYFTGEMSGYYLATSTSGFDGVDVFVEDAEGGQRLYFMKDEVKTYIDVVLREGYTDKCNVVLVTEPTCVYNWDAERGTFVTTLGEVSFYIGTYGSYNTMSVSKFSYIEDVSKIGVSQFPAGLCTFSVAVNFVETPAVDTAYKFALEQNELGQTLYFTGEMSGYYLATSANPGQGVDVFVENVEGGQRMYFMKDEVKTYIDVVLREGYTDKCNVVLVAEPTCVYNWDAERGTFVTTLGEVSFYIGTYGSYNTMSVSKFSYIEDVSKIGVSQFPAGLCTVG